LICPCWNNRSNILSALVISKLNVFWFFLAKRSGHYLLAFDPLYKSNHVIFIFWIGESTYDTFFWKFLPLVQIFPLCLF
jgi:hypothetical protein